MMKRCQDLLWLGLVVAAIGVSMADQARGNPILLDTQDIKIRDASDSTVVAKGNEPSVAVHPDDWRILLLSINGAVDGSAIEWVSTDGGSTWKGDSLNDHSPDNGDPSVAILRGSPTRYLVQAITKDIGQRVVYTDSPSAPFDSQAVIISGVEQSTDKGFLCADNSASSPHSGRLYALWSWLQDGGLRLRYSDDRGVIWRPLAETVVLRPSGFTWGGVIAVAIAPATVGHVYVAWPNASNLQAPPALMSFKRSVTGGESFVPGSALGDTITSYPGGSFQARAPLPGGLNTGANSIPSMATDDQGNIYVAWCQRRQPPPYDTGPGPDAQVYVSKSTDEGDTWDAPVPITADPSHQWLPWIAWDDEAKALAAVYFDDRDDPNLAEVYLTVSYDRGASFVELPISDAPGSGDVFVGDYIGIACGGGIAYPVWCDDRESGVVKAFTSPILIGGIDDATITALVSQSCAGPGNPRVQFEVQWSTLADMDGLDELTVTPPGGAPVTITQASSSKTHQLVLYGLPCVNGNWTYAVESNKGALTSRSNPLVKTIYCMSCPRACDPPCELE